MSFAASWLRLREPYDRAATALGPLAAVGAALVGRFLLRAVDLGAGTGAAIRVAAPLLPLPQHWIAVERDADLLAEGERLLAAGLPAGVRVEWRQIDLATPQGLAQAFAEDVDLVSTSALFDLVSWPWLEALAGLLAARRAILWSRLTVDGRIGFAPPDPFDGRIRSLFRTHQQGDKGFGPALGPDAPAALRELFGSFPGRIVEAASDWRLGPADFALQEELIAGFARAAAEVAPAEAAAIVAWRERRLAHLAQGCSQLLIGHRDLAWVPATVA